jgi:hypothetical protein
VGIGAVEKKLKAPRQVGRDISQIFFKNYFTNAAMLLLLDLDAPFDGSIPRVGVFLTTHTDLYRL